METEKFPDKIGAEPIAEDNGEDSTPPRPSCDSPLEKIEFSEDSENDSDRQKYPGETTEDDDDDEDDDSQSLIYCWTKLKVLKDSRIKYYTYFFVLTLNRKLLHSLVWPMLKFRLILVTTIVSYLNPSGIMLVYS